MTQLFEQAEKNMVDKTEITKPIEIKDNSIERIAFDLMVKIAQAEHSRDEDFGKPSSREYYLKLFNQCHKVVSYSNIDVDDLLKD